MPSCCYITTGACIVNDYLLILRPVRGRCDARPLPLYPRKVPPLTISLPPTSITYQKYLETHHHAHWLPLRQDFTFKTHPTTQKHLLCPPRALYT